MNAKKVGSFIKEQRQELGLSQKELAEKLYITDKAVSKWETGRGLPDISSLEPLSNALNVSVSEIFILVFVIFFLLVIISLCNVGF